MPVPRPRTPAGDVSSTAAIRSLSPGERRPHRCGYSSDCDGRPEYVTHVQHRVIRLGRVERTVPRDRHVCADCARRFALRHRVDLPAMAS